MTRKERELIAKALRLFNDADTYPEGFAILARLVDPDWVDPTEGCEQVSIAELASGPDRTFEPLQVPPRKS